LVDHFEAPSTTLALRRILLEGYRAHRIADFNKKLELI
jgi:hypothetical protein